MGSEAGPILQVPEMWWLVPTVLFIQASRLSSDSRSASSGAMRSFRSFPYCGLAASSRPMWTPSLIRCLSNGSTRKL